MRVRTSRRGLTREEMHDLILKTADELFRQYGYEKTTIADIAEKLEMSPANVYKFFASKQLIIENCASLCIDTMKARLIKIAKRNTSAIARMRDVAFEIYSSNKEYFKNDHEVYRLVVEALQSGWNCVKDFDKMFLYIISDIVEDGIRRKEFAQTDVLETSTAIIKSIEWITHALLLPEIDPSQVEAMLNSQMRLLEKGLK